MKLSTPSSSQYESLELEEATGDLLIRFRAGQTYRYSGTNAAGETLANHFGHIVHHLDRPMPDGKPFSVGSYVIRAIIGNAKNRPYSYTKVEEGAVK